MMAFLPLLAFVLVNLIYLTAFFAGAVILGVHEVHYFLGGGQALFTLHVRGVKISVGTYIPVLSRIHIMVDGKKQPLKHPWQFHEQPILRRLMVTLCGPIALLITGLFLFIIFAYVLETHYIPQSEVSRLGIYPSPTAEIAGFRRGDKILKLNGNTYKDFNELVMPAALQSRDTHYTVLRNGQEVTVTLSALPEGFTPDYNEPFISLLAPFTIEEVMPSTPASEAGLERGDKITHVNGQSLIKFNEVVDAVKADTTGKITLTIERSMKDRKTHSFTVELGADSMVPGRHRIGIIPREVYNTAIQRDTFWEALGEGPVMTYHTVSVQIRAFVKIFAGQLMPRKALAGPIGIAPIQDNTYALKLFATIFTIFSLLNFLPLPRAAFWEMVALGYEAATRKPYAYRAFKTTRTAALVVVAAFYVYIFSMDILRLF